ncbi:PIR Superfamily Protein [Plasmodium ovale wallikeri]|uniref:PIR Superfamily Protein n=1 Tax=Plasmodium ovale wallikeri TaxID=864142 RepID=A0A1A9AK74_PLAOA|nr:PIR Superfamily Protein [Plasmodium ovale wallikeri]
MECKKGTSEESYKFCINSPYYEMLVQHVKNNNNKVINIKNCDILSTEWSYSANQSTENICKEFKFLYESLNIYRGDKSREKEAFTKDDCNFLNYWLNDKLRNNDKDISICVKEFYEEMKRQDSDFFSNPKDLENYLHVIDTEILENMKLLYELYDNAVKVINIIKNKTYKYEEHKSCNDYIEVCDKKYKEAMDRCLNSNVDYYNALEIFKDSYQFLTEPSSDKSNTCEYSKFNIFPKYDPVLERKQRNIMVGKILSAPLILSFVIPLLYKYTPFGPFFRAKTKMIKNRWINPDKNESELLLLSTDDEDNISENGEYNISYYSGTNL